MNDYQIILSDSENSETLTHLPVGIDEIGISFERSELYDGVFTDYTLSFKFLIRKGYGGDFIYQRVNIYGHETQINITINEKNPETDGYELFYTGVLDFNPDRGYGFKSSDKGVFYEVGTINSSKLAKFKARDEQQVSVYSNLTIDGEECETVSEVDAYFPGVPLYFTSQDFETYPSEIYDTATVLKELYNWDADSYAPLTEGVDSVTTFNMLDSISDELKTTALIGFDEANIHHSITSTVPSTVIIITEVNAIYKLDSTETTVSIINNISTHEVGVGSFGFDIPFTDVFTRVNVFLNEIKLEVRQKYSLASGSVTSVSSRFTTENESGHTSNYIIFQDAATSINSQPPSNVDILVNQIGNTIFKPTQNNEVLIENTDDNPLVYTIDSIFTSPLGLTLTPVKAILSGNPVISKLSVAHGYIYELKNTGGTVVNTYSNLKTTTIEVYGSRTMLYSNAGNSLEITIPVNYKLCRKIYYNVLVNENVLKITTNNTNKFKINAFGVSEAPFYTNFKAIKTLDLGKKLIEKITGETNQSKLLTTNFTDSSIFSKILNFNGFKLRGFPENNFSTSFDNYFKSYKNTLCLGLGYDFSNDRFYFSEKKNFYKDVLIYDLGEVSDYEETPNKDAYFSEMQVGLEDVSYDAFQGANEYAQNITYSTSTPVKNSLNLVSPYHFGTIASELCRRKRYLEYGSTDTKFDNLTFMVHCEVDLDELYTPELNYSNATGFEGIELYYNIEFAPRSIAKRWVDFTKVQLRLSSKQQLITQEHARNKDISYKTYSDATVSNLFDNIIDEFTESTPLFDNKLASFKAKFTGAIINAIKSEPHGYFQYQIKDENGSLKTKKMFLKSVQGQEKNQTASYVGYNLLDSVTRAIFEDETVYLLEDGSRKLMEE